MKPKGKSKYPPSVQEQETIVTMAASGQSQSRIATSIGRSRHMVKGVMEQPEIQRAIQDEKAELSILFKNKARAIVESIDSDVIDKGNLLQRATAPAICLDKSLLLSGDVPIVRVEILLAAVQEVRDQRKAEAAARTLPAPGTGQAQ